MNFDWMRGRLRAGVLAGLLGGAVLSAAAATKVAVIVPLSGGLAAAGKEIESTSRAWAAQINAKAGTGSVDLLVLDDKSSADGARAAARQAVAQGAVMVMNCFGSVACMAIAEELKPSATPLIGAIAGDERLRGPDLAHVFTTRGGARDEIDVILKYLQGVGLRDLVVVYQDDGFGQSYKRALDEVLKSRPAMNAVATLPLSVSEKNHVQVATLAAAKPSQGVVLLTNTPNSLALIEAMNKAGYRGLYFNLAAQANPVFVKRIGELTATNKLVAAFVTMTPHPLLPSPGLAPYRDTLERHGQGLTPSYLGLESYLNASLTALLLRKDGKPDRDATGKQLQSLSGSQLLGLPIQFDPERRQVLRWINLSVVTSDGRVRSY